MSRYRFISDPGHGWLEVPIEELATLGIAHLISSCSYFGKVGERSYVYLEEDCDLSVYLTAKFGTDPIHRKIACTRFRSAETTDVHQERTFIRRLPSYPKAEGYDFKQAMAYCQPQPGATP